MGCRRRKEYHIDLIFEHFYTLNGEKPIRYSEYTDSISSMTTFTTNQVKICTACGVKVPKECMPATVRKKLERQENPKKRGRKPKEVNE